MLDIVATLVEFRDNVISNISFVSISAYFADGLTNSMSQSLIHSVVFNVILVVQPEQ